MEYLKHNEPKYLVQYLNKRLKGRGYLISKSPRLNNTYYFKSDVLGQKTIRISDHHLHINQYKKSQIDVVIENDSSVTINKHLIPSHEKIAYRAIIADFILKTLPRVKK